MCYVRWRGWSGDLMTTDCENVQESEASDFYVCRFKSQEVFVKRVYEFPGAIRNLRIPNRPSESLIAEENLEPRDDVEIEESDKNGKKNKRFVVYEWSIMTKLIWKFEAFPIPLKYVDVMRLTQASS